MGRWRNFSLAILCALIAACATPPIEIERHVYSIAVPGTALVLEFPSEGFKLEVADNNPPYFYFSNEKTKLNVSFRFARATECKSSETCRNYFANEFSPADTNRKNWHHSRIGDVYISESMNGSADNSGARQQYMNAHFVKEGMWVNVRLSQTAYAETDREPFVKMIRSIQFWPKLRE